ncbi:MAG TPA: HlyD family efflux transporter periplasmic adaptor subunit, partial [Acidimicrobiia bacterium]|nr:HlyD family efflux transporter periplasmic adaptor subunit [Acidimicrobiia bacterium]
RRSVDAALTGTATIEPVSQAKLAFPIGGTVAAVNVKVGDPVTVGQSLASLDPASLLSDLAGKQQALAQAQLTLDNALSGQSTSTAGGAGGAGDTGSSGSSSGAQANASLRSSRSGTTPTARFVSLQTTSPDPEIASAQQAVIAAQHAVDVAIANADNALHTATAMCAPIGNDPNTPPTSQQVSACQQALAAVQSAQGTVRDKQNALVDASNKLDDLLQQRANEPPPTTTPPTTAPATTTPPPANAGASEQPAPSAPSGSAGGGGNGQSRSGAGGNGGNGAGGRTGGGSSPSAADLAADQQAVDAAAADVAMAEQALNQATIGSPIDGTVVAVNLNVGDTVDAASSTANIVVQGDGGYEVATTVSVDRVGQVAVGQPATLVPDGGRKALTGKVAYVSVVPTTSGTNNNQSSATPTYLVIVGLDRSDANLQNGSTGTVSITTGSATAALAVPTSAVTTFGNRHTVEVLDGGNPRRVGVTIGAVGDTWTEIKGGLRAGEEVVLANTSEPLPSSATQSATQNGADGFPSPFRFGGTGFPSNRRVGG